MKRVLRPVALGLVACALLAASGAAAADEFREQRIKTAFLVNFARFVIWPEGTFAVPTSPIEMCILGSDAFGVVLADLARDKVVNERPLRISRVFRAEDLRRCHIAYLEDPAAARTDLAALVGHHVLTVYENDVTQAEGVIRFYIDRDHVRFEVNVAAARRAHLQLSAKLLSLARIVEH